MADVENKPHFSKLALDIGDKFQNSSVGKWLRHSDSPAYQRLTWGRLPDVDPKSIAWVEIPGNPKAGLFARWWHNAAILGAEAKNLREVEGFTGPQTKDAVLYEEHGVVRIGINPDDNPFIFGLELVAGGDSMMKTVAMRLGRGPLRAAMGLYRTDVERLYVPDEAATVITPFIANDAIQQGYPHTPLV